MAAYFLLLGLGLPIIHAQSSQTVTSTVVNIQTSTFTPTITVDQDQSCNCSVDICSDLVLTWNPFSFSSMSSSSHSLTTATTTSTKSTSIPIPTNLYIFTASDAEAVDIDSSGNMVLVTPSGLTSAFILNADGTLTTYGSNLNLFVDFSNVISTRDINIIYSAGFCASSLLRRNEYGRDTTLIARQGGSTAYSQFTLTNNLLQLITGGSTYGFVNCVGSEISVYDTLSDSIPSACGIVDLSASSVPTASYSQYYSVGLSVKSQYTDISTCTTSQSSSSSSDTATYTDNKNNLLTEDGSLEGDFTSPGNPYPIFAMSIFDGADIFVGDNLRLISEEANYTHFHGFQKTPGDGMILYGAGATIYANTSVQVDNSLDKRVICDSKPVYLLAAAPGDTIPEGSTTGPFITDPDFGLQLVGYEFFLCNNSAPDVPQVLPTDCPVLDGCTIVNLGLFLMDSIAIQQALYNGGLFAQKVFTAPPTPTPTLVTIPVPETNAVNFARDFLQEGQFSGFCSSELGYYTTATVVENEYSTVATASAYSYTVVANSNYAETEIASVTTATTSTTISTSLASSTKTYLSLFRVLKWATRTSISVSITSTILKTQTFYPTTTTSDLIVLKSVTTISLPILRRDLQGLEKRTQAQGLTPTALQGYGPEIVASACSLYFQYLQSNLSVTPTTFTFSNDITTTIPTTYISYTSTLTSTVELTFPISGTKTSYVYTTTVTSTTVSVSSNIDYRNVNSTTTVSVTDVTTNIVKSCALQTLTVTDGASISTKVLTQAIRTVCPPRVRSGGVRNANGVAGPFFNVTRPFKYDTNRTDEMYGYWQNIPADYPDSPIIGYVRGVRRIVSSNDWVSIFLIQQISTCLGCTYYFKILYKWYWTRLYTEGFRYSAADPFGVGYNNSYFRVNVMTTADQYGEPEPRWATYAWANTDIAASRDPSAKGASPMTGNFTANATTVFLRLGLSWLNYASAINQGALSIDNYLYIYNISVGADPL
ncbi:hypothetical protein H072_7170 [Dactylellina haptotyla CBS 200.50]|uniref:Uncharacterized protein n=1 Tax=Dactylellina haptotyla (strain CBS 200.50) TaxID=1284197 RepID=S8BUT1_DACHA|nr:hypothetical protein H072_7170 [Dactylellina haptotyla CBS 200.50]